MSTITLTKDAEAVLKRMAAKRWAWLASMQYAEPGMGGIATFGISLPEQRKRIAAWNAERVALAKALLAMGVTLPTVDRARCVGVYGPGYNKSVQGKEHLLDYDQLRPYREELLAAMGVAL